LGGICRFLVIVLRAADLPAATELVRRQIFET
jgi:hypothetical protein